VIVRLDTDSGTAKLEAEYQSPLKVKCHPDPSNAFHQGIDKRPMTPFS
jgi:hypothetical protein